MKEDISVICNSCLHCQVTTGGLRIPRALGHALHATKPNELLHFDYLYMEEAKTGEKYILILKDDLSSFVMLHPHDAATSDKGASSLLLWFSLFGVVPKWVSDQGPHFKNELMLRLTRSLQAHHHFTTAYTPQANGTVEHMCQEVLRACRALLSEFRLSTDEWPKMMPLIQSILNHSRRPSMENIAPITAFASLPPDNPVRNIIIYGYPELQSISYIRAEQILNIKSMTAAVDSMHSRVAKARTRKREESIRSHNKHTNIQQVNFEVGEFVLVGNVLSESGSKLNVKWKGPYRVVRIMNEFVSVVEDLVNGKEMEVHNSRLKFYSDSKLNIT